MRFKSILGAFIFISLASFLALVIFIQTKTFGNLATKIISDISQRKANTEVKIKSLGISLFPVGFELNNVKIAKKLNETDRIQMEFGKLGFYAGLIELEDKSLSLGEFRISDSVIDYISKDTDDEELKEIDQKIINQIFDGSNKLPMRVDTVLVENSRIFINHDLLEIKRLKITKRDDTFLTRFHVSNLMPVKDNDFSLDEIWADLEIGRRDVNLHRLKVQHDVQTMLIKGKITNYPKLKNAEVVVAGESSVYLSNLKDIVTMPEILSFGKGAANLSFNASMKNQEFNGTADIFIKDLNSNLVEAEELAASLTLENSIVTLKSLQLKNKDERLALLSPSEIFNLKNKQYLYKPLNARVERLHLNNALRILPSLKVLKGKLSGDISFSYKNRDFYFTPSNGFLIHDLGLIVGEEEKKPFTIVMIEKAKLTSASIRVINNEFQMESIIELKHSLLNLKGFVNKENVQFTAPNSVIDLEDFGNISQLDVKGKGTLDLNVSGPLDGTIINLKGKTQNFEVLGYRFGYADKDLSVDLGKSNVVIHKLESTIRNTSLSGFGEVNYGNSDISLHIKSPKANFHDLKDILHPLFSKMTFLPEDMNFNSKITADITGKTNMKELVVTSDVKFSEFISYGESFSRGELSILLKNHNLQIKNLVAQKGAGELRGDFKFSLLNDRMDLNYEWEDIELNDFTMAKRLGLNINGLISGTIVGDGTTKNYLINVLGNIRETHSQDYKFEDSTFNINVSPEYVSGKMALLGKIILSDFDYSFGKSRPSMIKLDVDAPDIKPFAVAFLGQHLENEQFTGRVKFNLDTSFRGNFEKVDLTAGLTALNLKHENFNVNFRDEKQQFWVKDNQIRRWNLSIQEPDLRILTKGEGTFGKRVALNHEVHFNARIFELLIAPVLSSEGFIRNSLKVRGNGDQYDFSGSSEANDLNITVEGVPVPLNSLSYALEYADKRLMINEMKTTLESGSASIKGDVFFDDAEPDVNVKYVFDNAEIPILGKSVVNISGEGIVLGNEAPYNISGEIAINKAQIVNELNDFTPKSSSLANVRFLPPNQESPAGKLFNLNVNVKAENPVRISNSLMDISLKGEVRVLGNPARLRGEGRLYSPPNASRVFFKNNEYFLTNADLNFSPKKEITNPDFDIQAMTLISSYKVNAKAYGDLDRSNFDLTSDPSLPRNSILSLIAFGYTDEIQSSLSQNGQQNLTQVGVGSFVFDRFKISDILNKQFGLQVNLGTVFEQSQTDSLLSGRTQEGQGTLGRTRSASKIELKKRLDEALSLSVSSTMGGNIGQRQSMNLNYSLRKNVQLEGVYEIRTNAEGEEDIIDNSIGGDLKFRWTFK